MARGLVALAAMIAALILDPAVATALDRYAAPNGSEISGCEQANPCEIHRALATALQNEQVIITTGDYGSAGAPLTGTILPTATGLDVHGEDGKPRPRIFVATGNDASALVLPGPGTKARHLELQQRPSSGSRQAALELDNAEATDIVVHNFAPQGKACVVLHDSLLRNSLCEASGASSTNAMGIATFTGVGPGAVNNSVLRNVTAIAPGAGGVGIEALAGNNTGEDQHLTVSNAIVRGASGSADVGADNPPGGSGVATVTIDHSNFGFVSSLPVGSGVRVVDGPSGGNQRFGTVNFVATGDYHQAAGSPTIDKGATGLENGSTDFDGDPRALGPGTDIGADEFVSPPLAVTGVAGGVTTSTAVLNATVNPNALATTYHFDFGRSAGYGSSTAETGAGAGTANLGAAATLTGLVPATTYHFRIVATNRGGTTVGADRAVTTQARPGGSHELVSLNLAPSTFAAAARGGSVQSAARRRRIPVDTTVAFTLNESATVRFTVRRARPGRRVGRRCVKPRKSNRRRRKCTRYVRVKGSFSVAGVAGKNRFRFTGRMRRRKLARGRYRLLGNAGADSKAVRFRIVRG